jgi:hypothetical protein
MITRSRPDRHKSESLRKMAEITLERLKETDLKKYPTNTLNDYYDIIHKLMEALTIFEGVKIRGEGAHKELIDYVAKKHGLDEQTRQFLQQMRDYRNRISYEGFMINRNYIEANREMIDKIVERLFFRLDQES